MNNEGNQNDRSIKEQGQKIGKEALRREMKRKNPVQKVILRAVKAAVIPMLITCAKVALVAILVSVVIAMFINIIDGNADSALEAEYANSSNNYIIKTDEAGAAPVLDAEQLELGIEAYFTEQAQTNYLDALDAFIQIQEEYNVNAVFAIAVAQKESCGGTAWDAISPDTYNWMSQSSTSDVSGWASYSSFGDATIAFGKNIALGDYYFKENRYDVDSISERYCATSEEWAEVIKVIMTDFYKAVGINIEGQIGDVTIDGLSTFIDSRGRTYIEYKQTVEEYKNVRYCHTSYGNSLYNVGCAVTSDAIIGSGFGSTETPLDVRNYCANNYSACDHCAHLKRLTGLTWTKVSTNSWDPILQQLRNGYPVMLAFSGSGKVLRTSQEHRIAVLSISSDGSQVYISDPGPNSATTNGWQLLGDLQDIRLIEYFKVGN